jgi:hypothetical protein
MVAILRYETQARRIAKAQAAIGRVRTMTVIYSPILMLG